MLGMVKAGALDDACFRRLAMSLLFSFSSCIIKGRQAYSKYQQQREIDPSHVKETSFTCLLVIN